MMKNNNKSVRLDDFTYNYVLNYRGDGFNEKFENIVLDASMAEADRKKRIAELDDEIEFKFNQLHDLTLKIYELESLIVVVEDVVSSVKSLEKKINNFISWR